MFQSEEFRWALEYSNLFENCRKVDIEKSTSFFPASGVNTSIRFSCVCGSRALHGCE